MYGDVVSGTWALQNFLTLRSNFSKVDLGKEVNVLKIDVKTLQKYVNTCKLPVILYSKICGMEFGIVSV